MMMNRAEVGGRDPEQVDARYDLTRLVECMPREGGEEEIMDRAQIVTAAARLLQTEPQYVAETVTAYVGLIDTLRALHPWVERMVQAVADDGDELDDATSDALARGDSLRGAALVAAGNLGTLSGEDTYTHTSDQLHVFLRRLNEGTPQSAS